MTNKTKLALGVAATLIIAGALASPQAMAADPAPKKAKKAHHHHHQKVIPETYHSESSVSTPNAKMALMEEQLQAVQGELRSLRAEARRPVNDSKVDDLEQRVNAVVAGHKEAKKSKEHMIYFRGGYARNDAPAASTTNNLNGPVPGTTMGSQSGWNFGGGIDLSLSDNMFGLMHNTELLGELDLNYAQFGNFTSSVGGLAGYSRATQSEYRITAAPKIKFFKDSKLRPWIIPVGFTMNIMSPPSQANTITELMPGMHFGTGVDYNIWKSIYVGVDTRYNMAFSTLNGTNVNGLTAGGYLGFGF